MFPAGLTAAGADRRTQRKLSGSPLSPVQPKRAISCSPMSVLSRYVPQSYDVIDASIPTSASCACIISATFLPLGLYGLDTGIAHRVVENPSGYPASAKRALAFAGS